MKRNRIVTSRAVCGVLGKGKNVTEAKEDARKRIERAFSEDENYNPEVLEHAGYIAVMFRTLDGWGYQFIAYPMEEPSPGFSKLWGSSGTMMSYEECKRSMARHVADNAFTPGDPITEAPEFVTNANDREELVKGWRWQNFIVEGKRTYALDDESARHYADLKMGRGGFGAHSLRPDQVERVKEVIEAQQVTDGLIKTYDEGRAAA